MISPEDYGYRLDTISVFAPAAPQDLVDRADEIALQDGGYSWVLWDPQDDVDGFLLVGDHPDALRREFAEHFPDLFDEAEEENPPTALRSV